MTYDIDARIREIAKEERRVRRWRKRIVGFAIITGAALLLLEILVVAWVG